MRNPVFVACADVHLHPHPHGNTYDSEGHSSRVALTIAALREVLVTASKLNVPCWILGDLLHEKHHVPVEVIEPLLQLRDEFREVYVNLLVGNHERPDRFSDVNTLSWLANGDRWHVYEGVERLESTTHAHDFDIYTMPWYSDPEEACTELRRLVSTAPGTVPRVLLGHGCVDGSMSDNGFRLSNPKLSSEKLWLQSFNLVLFGDIHKHQRVTEEGNGWYVGALHPQNFGERHNPAGFVVVYDDFTFERVEVQAGARFAYGELDENQPLPSKASPYFVDVETGDITDLNTTMFIKPSPEAVAAASFAGHKGMRLEMDTTDLESMVAAYMTAYPPPVEAATDVASVVAAVKGMLS